MKEPMPVNYRKIPDRFERKQYVEDYYLFLIIHRSLFFTVVYVYRSLLGLKFFTKIAYAF